MPRVFHKRMHIAEKHVIDVIQLCFLFLFCDFAFFCELATLYEIDCTPLKCTLGIAGNLSAFHTVLQRLMRNCVSR